MEVHLITFLLVGYGYFSRAAPLPGKIALDLEILTVTTTVPPMMTFTRVMPFPAFTPLFAPSSPPFIVADQSSTYTSDSESPSIGPVPPTIITDVTTAFTTIAAPRTTEVVMPVMPPPVESSISEPLMSLTPSPSSTPQATPLATWTPPAESSDLDCWNVTKFPNGKDKVQVVRGIPFSASATTSSPASTAASTPDHVSPSRSNDTHILQLFYPRNSINPANFPQGGAEFYASPLPGMLNATNVTFEYSTFFPNDFLWMKGGKLPGLFGGHTGCSGGNVADTCFSTRIMWRANGMGELYLYVDKSKQRPNLCTSTPYTSECNPQYGLSLARGSFNFTPGAWTHLKQTVRLNTPGVQDGGFTLDANGVRVLTLDGIFYRGVKGSIEQPPLPEVKPSSFPSPIRETIPPDASQKPQPAPTATPTTSADVLGGLLGGLLGGVLGSRPSDNDPPGGALLGSILRRSSAQPQKRDAARGEATVLVAPLTHVVSSSSDMSKNGQPHLLVGQVSDINGDTAAFNGDVANALLSLGPASSITMSHPLSSIHQVDGLTPRPSVPTATLSPVALDTYTAITPSSLSSPGLPLSLAPTPSAGPLAISTISPQENYLAAPSASSNLPQPEPAFGFSGIFFSTFFGGHDPSWASPVDQYVWFKDFKLSVNA